MRKLMTKSFIAFLVVGLLGVLNNFSNEGANAGTPISGTITANTTWTLLNSPYWIEGDTIVAPGATLTIEPGVEVRFNDSYSLYIEGELMALGTSGNEIKFASNTPMGSWNRIQINSTGHVEIGRFNITNGVYGIYLDHTSNNSISNGTFSNNGYGIMLDTSSNNTIADNILLDNGNGIYLAYSSNNDIMSNIIISQYGFGIHLGSSSNNNISNNQMWNNNSRNLDVLNNYDNNIAISNNVNGKPVYYIAGLKNAILEDLAPGHFTLIDCDNVTIRNINATNSDGIILYSTTNAVIRNNNLLNNSDGIRMYHSSHNKIVANNISRNGYGFYLLDSTWNLIYHNNILNNSIQAFDPQGIESDNQWNNPYPSGGNFWSDYSGSDGFRGLNQDVPGSDGIGDSSHLLLSAVNQDHLPLMTIYPYAGAYPPVDIVPPQIYDLPIVPSSPLIGTNTKIPAYVKDDSNEIQGAWISITGPEGSAIGNFSMKYDLENDEFSHEITFSTSGVYSYIIWACDGSDNWASSSGQFTVGEKGLSESFWWAILIVMIVGVILGILIIRKKRRVRESTNAATDPDTTQEHNHESN